MASPAVNPPQTGELPDVIVNLTQPLAVTPDQEPKETYQYTRPGILTGHICPPRLSHPPPKVRASEQQQQFRFKFGICHEPKSAAALRQWSTVTSQRACTNAGAPASQASSRTMLKLSFVDGWQTRRPRQWLRVFRFADKTNIQNMPRQSSRRAHCARPG